MPHDMNTLSEAITVLREDGYNEDFKMVREGLGFKNSEKIYKPSELIIKRVYRFEGISDPADMSVVYAIETNDGKKGIFIDAFGTYSDHDPLTVADFFNKVKIENQHGDH